MCAGFEATKPYITSFKPIVKGNEKKRKGFHVIPSGNMLFEAEIENDAHSRCACLWHNFTFVSYSYLFAIFCCCWCCCMNESNSKESIHSPFHFFHVLSTVNPYEMVCVMSYHFVNMHTFLMATCSPCQRRLFYT